MSGLDERVHHPVRLQLCALLNAVDEVEFAFARQQIGVADSVLSKHAKALEEAGYLIARKGLSAGRRRTWFAFTATGRRAFAEHIQELQRLAGGSIPR
ncbi:transcriptional regulator [Microbacterium gorillae]|uniref:transcriptional regulator n=1 Tax=Microbacterium gorillae TaxID=1231063 RepID=UPI003D9860E7